MKLFSWCLSIALFFPLANSTLAQEDEEETVMSEKPMLKTNEISEDFVFDGIFNLDEWNAGTDSIADLITIDPEEGGIPAAPTVIKIFTNRNDTRVAQHCYDIFPNDIVCFSNEPDSELDQDDQKEIPISESFKVNGLAANTNFGDEYYYFGEIFIVYNHNIVRDDEKDRWKFISNELPIKIQYTWRF